MLLDFGVAAVVAAVVALFVTGKLPISWSLATSGKTTERPADATAHTVSAPSKFAPSSLALVQSSAATARAQPEGQSARMVVALASTASTTAPPADAASSPSPQPVLGPATNSEEAGKGQQTYAAVSATEPSGRASPVSVELTIARELQGELKRVGCDPGNIDDDWNAASRRALENFNEHAGTNLDVEVANFSALSVVRSRMSRICPVACDRGPGVRGNRCLEVETQSVRRTADRNQMKRRRSTSSATRMPVGATTSRDARSEPARTNLR
jgi:hypothetical protein